MIRGLDQLFLQARVLRKACLIAAIATVIQTSFFLMASSTLVGTLSANHDETSMVGFYLTRGLIFVMVLTTCFAAWGMTVVMNQQNRSSLRFLAQLPVASAQIHRAKLRTKLIGLFIPLLICLGLFVIGAAYIGILWEMVRMAINVIVVTALGLAIFEWPFSWMKTSRWKIVIFFLATVTLLGAVVVVDFWFTTGFAGLLAAFLLHRHWQMEARPVLVAPQKLVGDESQSESESESQSESKFQSDAEQSDISRSNAIELPAKSPLRKWILKHTLYQKPMFILSLMLLIGPTIYGSNFDYSNSYRGGMTLFFLGILGLGAASVTKKLDSFPISRWKIFHHFALPTLALLLIGVAAHESWNYGAAVLDAREPGGDLPIRFEFDSSLTVEGSTQQVVVPAQLLELSPNQFGTTVTGVRGERYTAPSLSLFWFGGPRLFNPYYVPEVSDYKLDSSNISFQLVRALTKVYGESLPAAEIHNRFWKESSNGNRYFLDDEFLAWQQEWAAAHPAESLLEQRFLIQNSLWLMPARALGWILGWGAALSIALMYQARYISRRRRFVTRIGLVILIGLYFLVEISGLNWSQGFVTSDGFKQRVPMLATEFLRENLPDSAYLAWLLVALAMVAVYGLTYHVYRSTEWVSVRPVVAHQLNRYEKWLQI
jgi:hypothetical protein